MISDKHREALSSLIAANSELINGDSINQLARFLERIYKSDPVLLELYNNFRKSILNSPDKLHVGIERAGAQLSKWKISLKNDNSSCRSFLKD